MVTISNLPRQTEEEIQQLVDSGDFENVTDVVVKAVHAYVKRREQTERLRELLQEGVDAANRGEVVEVTPEFRRQIREEARALARSGEPLESEIHG
jgi:Arc/MetJ-type ribon-helix-helix transcriptional regulator